jgi:hypothetical protein
MVEAKWRRIYRQIVKDPKQSIEAIVKKVPGATASHVRTCFTGCRILNSFLYAEGRLKYDLYPTKQPVHMHTIGYRICKLVLNKPDISDAEIKSRVPDCAPKTANGTRLALLFMLDLLEEQKLSR